MTNQVQHPGDRWNMTRREFVRTATGGAVALTALGAILAACGDDGPTATTLAAGGLPFPLARPGSPVTWPISDTNRPIASGLQPEQNAVLKIYNWVDYLDEATVQAFADEFGCSYEISTYGGVDEALAKLRTGQLDFDVFFPDPSFLGRLITADLIQPINLDYIPNLANVWPSLQDPYYDLGSRYTVPYTVYSTGIGWRNDLVEDDPSQMANPYDILWDPKYKGRIHMFDDFRETIGFALLRAGVADLNTEDPALVEQAKQALIEMIDLVNVKLDISDYTHLPEGSAWIHQAWSGGMVYAQYNLPEDVGVEALSYWFPARGGVVGNDNLAILKAAKNPVLAHEFLNWMLDSEQSYNNYVNYTGYQPPQNDLDPDSLVADEVVAENLKSVVVRPEDFDNGQAHLELSPDGDALWHDAYQEFAAGA